MRRVPVVSLILSLGVACGGGGGGGDAAANDEGKKPGIQVEAKDYSFEPAQLTAAPGDVSIDLKNTGAVEHDFTIDDPKLKITALANRTKSGEVTLPAGTYDFYCSVAGHRGQGMEGKLTVQ